MTTKALGSDPFRAATAAALAGSTGDVRRGVRLQRRERLETYRVRAEVERCWDLVHPPLRTRLDDLATGRRRWPLYLWGHVGRGKTRAVWAFCDRVHFARYWTVRDLMSRMQMGTAPWDWLASPQLAVLDELGVRDVPLQFEYDAVKAFADWREDQPTIYISNLAPDMMNDVYDRRIESRVTCGSECELTGPDRRKA